MRFGRPDSMRKLERATVELSSVRRDARERGRVSVDRLRKPRPRSSAPSSAPAEACAPACRRKRARAYRRPPAGAELERGRKRARIRRAVESVRSTAPAPACAPAGAQARAARALGREAAEGAKFSSLRKIL